MANMGVIGGNMNKKSVKCSHCAKEITSIDDLIIGKWYGFFFKKYHKDCYEKVASMHQNKISKPIELKSNVILLLIINVIILGFLIITTGNSKLTFLGLFLLAVFGLDLPYFLTWINVLRPLSK